MMQNTIAANNEPNISGILRCLVKSENQPAKGPPIAHPQYTIVITDPAVARVNPYA